MKPRDTICRHRFFFPEKFARWPGEQPQTRTKFVPDAGRAEAGNLKQQHKDILVECLSGHRRLPKKAPPVGNYSGRHGERLREAARRARVAAQVECGPEWSSPLWFGAYDDASQKRHARAL